jgi:two-component system cell cycle sensor histidine kinase/response regulator CckA
MTLSAEATGRQDRHSDYLRAIFDSVNEAIFVDDAATGRILDVNATCCRMYGYSCADMLKLDIGCLSAGTPPYDQAHALRWLEQARRGPVAPFEWLARHQDGHPFWVEVSIRFVCLGDDERFVVTVRDISERKREEAALIEVGQRLRLLLEQVPNLAVQEYGGDGIVTYWNEASERIYGYTAREAVGRNLVDLIIPPDMKLAARAAIADMVKSGVPLPAAELVLVRKDGSPVPVYSSHAVVTMPGCAPVLFCLDIDLTERKREEEERIRMERQMLHAQRLESLGLLAGGIAHDFNNLLTAILGNVDLALQDAPADAPFRNCLEDAILAVRRASDLTRQMLAYSGKGRFIMQDVSLSVLVEENAKILQAAVDKSVELRLDLDHALPLVHADPGQLQQVVMNLLLNASESLNGQPGVVRVSTGVQHFTAEELRSSRIEEKPEAGRYVYLRVTDTGCGIDDNGQRHMFDPFFTTKRAGRGLGLPAVLGIVRGHHGAILLDSRVGAGTRFTALFPIVAPSDGDAHSTASRAAAPRPAPTGCILVVDDEDVVRTIGQRMVERLGFCTLVAVDGEQAIQVFRHHADDITCTLLDLTMPRLDGMACFQEIRRIRPDARVILSSGYTQDEIERRYGSAGFSGFVHKPYDLRALQAEIERVLAFDVQPPGPSR